MKFTIGVLISFIATSSYAQVSFEEFGREIHGDYYSLEQTFECSPLEVRYTKSISSDWNSREGEQEISIIGDVIIQTYYLENYNAKKRLLLDSNTTDLSVITKGRASFQQRENGTFILKERTRVFLRTLKTHCTYKKKD